ncbi:C-C motif chemokine 26-like [Artibeus jamaicensis]|uniref:C-C motif chemokine 26-like n=1 Tax=Artibeus jamaicensis TaxID=9417 RepID=UPI00235B208C|nr:C-C motif chemokine 26-like [Artibeus jamaicensis]XP_053511326.1 C-C motif chemokine 26-like [Artibeus jamaicensis]XP_053511327.1 C-C motif chemokine 26-like [Artibeus jamaicensis]XP_053511328.1 C-C motif chemokine 26-like [Artibeus jamaicensis]
MKGSAWSTMKSFPKASLVLLLFILSVHLGTATRGSNVAKYCCLQFSPKALPWKLVQSYEFTRSSCPQQAVIFTTKKGLKVCAEPEEKWVQKYISLLKAQRRL